MNKFLEGKKTWIGIITMVLGYLGLGYLISPAQLGDIMDTVVKLVGLGIAVYGNYKSHKKLGALSK